MCGTPRAWSPTSSSSRRSDGRSSRYGLISTASPVRTPAQERLHRHHRPAAGAGAWLARFPIILTRGLPFSYRDGFGPAFTDVLTDAPTVEPAGREDSPARSVLPVGASPPRPPRRGARRRPRRRGAPGRRFTIAACFPVLPLLTADASDARRHVTGFGRSTETCRHSHRADAPRSPDGGRLHLLLLFIPSFGPALSQLSDGRASPSASSSLYVSASNSGASVVGALAHALLRCVFPCSPF